MLFWHKHNLDKSLSDLANFTPFPGTVLNHFHVSITTLHGGHANKKNIFY